MDKVVVYPGRFQPMLKHHAEVYQRLVNEYPDAEVYIGTSDKVEPGKSPFNFAEKQKIAQAHGIDPSRVLQVKNPYHMDSYPFDKDNTQVIFAVGEKDAEQRFPANSVKKDGTPGYYQRLGSDSEPLPMSKRGYITVAPNITDGGDVASASAFRSALQGARSPEEAKQIFVKQFGKYDPEVFNLIYNKVADKTMEQLDLNYMRRMAGLSENSFDQEEEAIQNELSSYAEKHALRGRDLEKYIGKTITLWQEGSTNPPFDRKFEIHPGKNGKGVWVVLAGDPMESGDNYEPEDFVISNAAGDYSWPSQEVANTYNDMYNDKFRDLYARHGEMSEAPEDRLKSNYYGMSDQQRQLADIGRALMNAQFKADDDEESNKLSLIGSELTRFGAEEGASSLEDLMRRTKLASQDELLKYMKMGQEMVARGEHEMGAQGAGGDDVEQDDDDFDTDADATAAVDDMEVDDEVAETALDLGDIRSEYGISEQEDQNEIEEMQSLEVDEVNQSVEEEDSYDTAILELAKLAGIATHDTNVAEIKGQVDPKKGENVGFGTVDKTELDPIVDEEAMDDTFIAKKVRDMGATLDDQRDFIKHLAHVAKELKLGKYVMDNPDFVPDVMMAFSKLDEADGCPCCGGGECMCASDCDRCGCRTDEIVAGGVAATLGRHAIKKAKSAIKDDEANEDTVYAEDDSQDLLDLFDLDDQDTDEAIGDGFLSGNKALGAAMQDIEDEITETPESALEATIKELRALAGL